MKDNNFINEWNGGKSNDSKYLKVYYKKTFQFKIKKRKTIIKEMVFTFTPI